MEMRYEAWIRKNWRDEPRIGDAFRFYFLNKQHSCFSWWWSKNFQAVDELKILINLELYDP